MTKRNEMYNELLENNTIELLEEVGKISIDQFEDGTDFDLLIKVLDEDFNIPCEIDNLIGGRFLINEHYEENRR